jgi:hypothetical protein
LVLILNQEEASKSRASRKSQDNQQQVVAEVGRQVNFVAQKVQSEIAGEK